MPQVMNLAAASGPHDGADATDRSTARHACHAHRADARPHEATLLLLPALFVSLALVGWMGFQSWLLAQEREALIGAHASQQEVVDRATKLRGSLDALAADTRRLADAGNPNAKLLVEELRRRGVTIHAPTAGAEASPPATTTPR